MESITHQRDGLVLYKKIPEKTRFNQKGEIINKKKNS